jgi:hypothetical protein
VLSVQRQACWCKAASDCSNSEIVRGPERLTALRCLFRDAGKRLLSSPPVFLSSRRLQASVLTPSEIFTDVNVLYFNLQNRSPRSALERNNVHWPLPWRESVAGHRFSTSAQSDLCPAWHEFELMLIGRYWGWIRNGSVAKAWFCCKYFRMSRSAETVGGPEALTIKTTAPPSAGL